MPLPTYDALMLPLLRLLADGRERDLWEVRSKLYGIYQLPDRPRGTSLRSRPQSAFENRVSWAKTYLSKAGLLASPRRGWCQITIAGLAVLAERPSRINRRYLLRFSGFGDFASMPAQPSGPRGRRKKSLGR